MVVSSGDSPPCMQKIFSSIIAATGRQLKQSVNVLQSLMLYLRLPLRLQNFSCLTFVVKSIHSIDGRALVISSEQEEVFWVFDLVGKKQADRL